MQHQIHGSVLGGTTAHQKPRGGGGERPGHTPRYTTPTRLGIRHAGRQARLEHIARHASHRANRAMTDGTPEAELATLLARADRLQAAAVDREGEGRLPYEGHDRFFFDTADRIRARREHGHH